MYVRIIEHKPNCSMSSKNDDRFPVIVGVAHFIVHVSPSFQHRSVEITAAATQKVGGWFLLLSSAYVFDGVKPPYQSNSPTNPVCEYGRMKLEAEKTVLKIHKEPVSETTTTKTRPTCLTHFCFVFLSSVFSKTGYPSSTLLSIFCGPFIAWQRVGSNETVGG
jgi:hypothetical protein